MVRRFGLVLNNLVPVEFRDIVKIGLSVIRLLTPEFRAVAANLKVLGQTLLLEAVPPDVAPIAENGAQAAAFRELRELCSVLVDQALELLLGLPERYLAKLKFLVEGIALCVQHL